jgi:hypothetical protein
MRVRIANPHREAHGKDLRVYEFIADGTKMPSAILASIEQASGLILHGGDPAGQHGYLGTRRLPSNAVLVQIVLYEECLNDVNCPAGHGTAAQPDGTIRSGTRHVRATDLTIDSRKAIELAVGLHPDDQFMTPRGP